MKSVTSLVKKIYAQKILVRPEDLDELNHVNNVVFVQWVQEVATHHWNELTSPEIRKNYSWVVVKHEIEYASPAFINDILVVKTWVEKSEGVRSERYVEFHNENTGKLVVRAKTNWCLLDSVTMRPKRIGTDIIELFH